MNIVISKGNDMVNVTGGEGGGGVVVRTGLEPRAFADKGDTLRNQIQRLYRSFRFPVLFLWLAI